MAAALLVTGGRKLPNATDKIIVDEASPCVTYTGRAESQDATTADAVWQIARTIFDGVSQYTTQFANNAEFVSVWDDRATYFDPPGACTPPPLDSVKISDGTDTLLINPDGSINFTGSVAIQYFVTTQSVQNVTATLANTEYSNILPANTKRYTIKSRNGVQLKLAFASGGTSVEWLTVSGAYTADLLAPLPARTLYFQSKLAGDVVEIVSEV